MAEFFAFILFLCISSENKNYNANNTKVKLWVLNKNGDFKDIQKMSSVHLHLWREKQLSYKNVNRRMFEASRELRCTNIQLYKAPLSLNNLCAVSHQTSSFTLVQLFLDLFEVFFFFCLKWRDGCISCTRHYFSWTGSSTLTGTTGLESHPSSLLISSQFFFSFTRGRCIFQSRLFCVDISTLYI